MPVESLVNLVVPFFSHEFSNILLVQNKLFIAFADVAGKGEPYSGNEDFRCETESEMLRNCWNMVNNESQHVVDEVDDHEHQCWEEYDRCSGCCRARPQLTLSSFYENKEKER